MEKVLILGASGLVGKPLVEELRNHFDVYGTYFSRKTTLPDDKQFPLAVGQIDKLKEKMQLIKPDIVISCLRGDYPQQLQFHRELALELRNTNGRLYYFSTTNVFDGDFSKPHIESDLPISETDYGKFKIECEHMLTEILGEQAMMIRIPAIWGKDSPRWNAVNESIRENKVNEVYSNLVCNHLLDVQLARQLRHIIENKLTGIFHLGSVDHMTQAEFYEIILTQLGSTNNLLKYQLLEDDPATCYFTLDSTRDDLPASLKTTNQEIIDYLLGKS
ncbi:sugar nucleotide-binding protein [Neobacillus sp. K501]